jgi:hypothetical protein
MAGTVVPKHNIPPAPIITSTVVGGLIAWRGSAGAVRYSIERYDSLAKSWQTICNKCSTDADDPWVDPHPALSGTRYRITAFNADDVPSPTSEPR